MHRSAFQHGEVDLSTTVKCSCFLTCLQEGLFPMQAGFLSELSTGLLVQKGNTNSRLVLCKSPHWRAGHVGLPVLQQTLHPALFLTTESFSSQVEEHNGHIFKATQYSIPTYCEYCSSLIWIMDRASVCKCKHAPFGFFS